MVDTTSKVMVNKKILLIFLSSLLLVVPLIVVPNINGNIQQRKVELVQANRQIFTARQNLAEINRFLNFKKKLGGEVLSIRVEPVNITADFNSMSQVERINDIINSTYSGDGYFFLNSFSVEQLESDNKSQTCSVQLNLSGKKVVVFGK